MKVDRFYHEVETMDHKEQAEIELHKLRQEVAEWIMAMKKKSVVLWVRNFSVFCTD
jgi:hypothetical protein